MKKIKQNKSNIILAAILVLLLCLFLIIRYTNSGIAATTKVDIDGTSKGASPKEQTDASKDRTVYEVNEWAGNVTKQIYIQYQVCFVRIKENIYLDGVILW